MLENILPSDICLSLNTLDNSKIQEVRIRANKPVTIVYNSQNYFLGHNGLTGSKNQAITCSNSILEGVVQKASNYSLYTINDELKQGYITIENGVRIGIVGQVVSERENIITIKNFTSLVVRFAHEIIGLADNVMDFLFEDEEFLNTLIISPPGAGKTTLLRDIIRTLSSLKYAKNVLIADERNEISASAEGISSMNLGLFSDIVVNCTKEFAFNNGIRAMAPDIIATDEIGKKSDYDILSKASSCGVGIIATIHAKTMQDLKMKNELLPLLNNKIFKRYIVLSKRKGVGTIEGIFDEDFKSL